MRTLRCYVLLLHLHEVRRWTLTNWELKINKIWIAVIKFNYRYKLLNKHILDSVCCLIQYSTWILLEYYFFVDFVGKLRNVFIILLYMPRAFYITDNKSLIFSYYTNQFIFASLRLTLTVTWISWFIQNLLKYHLHHFVCS